MSKWDSTAEKVYQTMTRGMSRAPEIRDVDELLTYIQNEPLRKRLSEEETLEQVIRAFDGDENYLIGEGRELMRQDEDKQRDETSGQGGRRDTKTSGKKPKGRLLVSEFARFLVEEPRGRVDYTLDDAVDMLKRYAAIEPKGGRGKATEVDLDAFKHEFARLRERKRIEFGSYNYKKGGTSKGRSGTVTKASAVKTSTKSKVRFVMPDAPVGNIDATMAGIGESLIRRDRNYEEALLRAIGPERANAARPLIDWDALYTCLRDLGVQLRVEERRALDAYFKERGSEQTREVQLTQLLTEVGLPPQTIGRGAQLAGQATKALDKKELQACADLMLKIQKECSK